MSGGTYDYAYMKVLEFVAENEQRLGSSEVSPLAKACREALNRALVKAAEAMRAVEYVDSGDSSAGSEVEAIHDFVESSDFQYERDLYVIHLRQFTADE